VWRKKRGDTKKMLFGEVHAGIGSYSTPGSSLLKATGGLGVVHPSEVGGGQV